MKANLKIKLGNKELNIEAEGDEKQVIKSLFFWGLLPDKCGNCGKDDITLLHKNPKGNDYYGLKCKNCSAEFNFGQFKQGGLYVKSNEKWSVWSKDNRDAPEAIEPF